MNQRDTPITRRDAMMPMLSLFLSTGTLLCCALPALLVTLGAGAMLAGLISAAPWLVALSKYKVWLFAIAGGLLVIAALLTWRARLAPCPLDSAQARACMRLRRFSISVLILAVVLYLVGIFFAFLAPLLN